MGTGKSETTIRYEAIFKFAGGVLFGLGALVLLLIFIMNRHFRTVAEVQFQDAAKKFSSRIDHIVGETIRRGEMLVASKSHLYQKSEITKDTDIISLAVYRKLNKPVDGKKWWIAFRLIRNKDDPARLPRYQFLKLNKKFPLDLDAALVGLEQAIPGNLNDGTPIFRVASKLSKNEVLVSDLFYEQIEKKIVGVTSEPGRIFSYATNTKDVLLFQSDLLHFEIGERLGHLQIVQASTDEKKSGILIHREFPDQPEQVAGFHKTELGGWLAVSQMPLPGIQAPGLLYFVSYFFFATGFGLFVFGFWWADRQRAKENVDNTAERFAQLQKEKAARNAPQPAEPNPVPTDPSDDDSDNEPRVA